jgi:hypothetical protein
LERVKIKMSMYVAIAVNEQLVRCLIQDA